VSLQGELGEVQIGPSDVLFGPRDRSDSTRSVFSHFGPRSVRSSKKGPKWMYAL